MRKSIKNKILQRFIKNEQGVTLVELAFVIPVLMVLVLGAVDYGRFGHHELMARKAVDLAVRTAAVRPPVCDGIPDTFQAVITITILKRVVTPFACQHIITTCAISIPIFLVGLCGETSGSATSFLVLGKPNPPTISSFA